VRDRAVSDVYRALTDPTRRAILDELSERDGQTLFELPRAAAFCECVWLVTNAG
jgi:hypothetical protein